MGAFLCPTPDTFCQALGAPRQALRTPFADDAAIKDELTATDGITHSEIEKMEEYGMFEIVVMLALAPVAIVVACALFTAAMAAIVFLGGPVFLLAGFGLLVTGEGWASILPLIIGGNWTYWAYQKWIDSAVAV